MFTKSELKLQLKEMGIRPTDTVLIHTSMRAIGETENGAHGVIDAFCEYLNEGLFLVPTHTWATINREHPIYDVRKEVPCIGALPRAAAFRKDGIRSLHPTHSVWAHGSSARDFVKNEEFAMTPAPPGFLWERLANVHAKILLIGVENDRNTFIHAIDELAQIPDRIQPDPFEVTILDYQGNVSRHMYSAHYCSKTPHVSQYYVNFEKPLTELGAQTLGKFGNATVRIIDAYKCREIILKIYSRCSSDYCLEYREIPEEFYH